MEGMEEKRRGVGEATFVERRLVEKGSMWKGLWERGEGGGIEERKG